MAFRVKIPWLVDVFLVWRPLEIRELEATDAIDRPVPDAGAWLNRRIGRRMDPGLRFDGVLLRVFRSRDDVTRRGPNGRSARFSGLPTHDPARRAHLVSQLARYVAGYPGPRSVGSLIQEALGTQFVPEYRSTESLYAAARRMERWFGIGSALGLGARRLASARRRLHSAAAGDLDCFHATTFAVHSAVDAIERMRAHVLDDRTRRLAALEAVDRCARPPKRALRTSVRAFQPSFRRSPLPAHVLVVYATRRAHRIDSTLVDPFAGHTWSECPGDDMVRALLRDVWEARRADYPIIAPRVWCYERLARFVGERLLGAFTWHKLPGLLGVTRLVGFRTILRERVLLDGQPAAQGPAPTPTRSQLAHRSADGTFNDLDVPDMGAAGQRFARNVPPTAPAAGDLLDPNPRAVSAALMTRKAFVPAPTLNVLAAAWIQFMVHGWFNHDPDEHRTIALSPSGHADDPFGEATLDIPASKPSPSQVGEPESLGPFFDNTETHWWDGSQLYGSDPVLAEALRAPSGGHLLLPNGYLPLDEAGLERSGFVTNWWIGLGVMHTLFAREHNAVCDHLARAHPGWSSDELYGRARLVIAALIAKIHTLEWTPAILDQPALHLTGLTTWQGVLRRLPDHVFPRERFRSDLWRGVPGSESTHHGVRYAMTEEFVSVYRMHQLLPDWFEFRRVEDDVDVCGAGLDRLLGADAARVLRRVGLESSFYSLGIAHAGAIVLDNFPATLQHFRRAGEFDLDLAAVDILRDRERGVPRYNAFRERLLLPPIRRFEDLTDDRSLVQRLKAAYGDDVDKLDLQVGMCAEAKPAGFGFGETAFRVFTLMAVRRLKSDRFFTTDYNEQTYSREGLEWIANNTFASVLARHVPSAATRAQQAANCFAPWPTNR